MLLRQNLLPWQNLLVRQNLLLRQVNAATEGSRQADVCVAEETQKKMRKSSPACVPPHFGNFGNVGIVMFGIQ